MDYDEFQRQVGKAGLTIKSFAELIRMNRISVSNYSKLGSVPAHLAIIATLLAEIVEMGGDVHSIMGKISIEAKKPRGGHSQKNGVDSGKVT